MRLPGAIGMVLLGAGAVLIADLVLGSSLLDVLRPRIETPADGAIVTGAVNVSWQGPRMMHATLAGNGQRIDLGLRESPFEIDPERFPRPGQYRVELAGERFGGLIRAERRFMVRRGRGRASSRAASMPEEHQEPYAAQPPPPRNREVIAQLEAEREQLRGQIGLLQKALAEARDDSAVLDQDLGDLQADADASLAAADRQHDDLVRQQALLMEENQHLRLRLESLPECTVWGYMYYPNPQTSPPSRMVVVSDRMGTVFRTAAECELGRRLDPSRGSRCSCAGPLFAGQ